jgi:outer membrane receptor protein involved in Fe transport
MGESSLRLKPYATTIVAVIAVVLLGQVTARGQLQVAHVRGIVVDAQGQPVAGAEVSLTDPQGNKLAGAISGPTGSFRIDDVVPGAYTVRVDVSGAVALARPLVVRGSVPIELSLKIAPAVHENVIVHGDASSNPAEHPATLAGDAVSRTAEPIPSQRVQAALASLPGWSAEDNGLLHVRGVDDGVLYVQDGIPVYERLDRLFGRPPNPAAIDSLHIMNGYVPPEFGFKTGAVVVVRSVSGIRGAWNGSVDAGIADLDTRHLQGFAAGPIGRSSALMVTASDERSSRFLDPVDPDNLHNSGRATSAAAQMTWLRGAGLLTTSVQGGRDRYDVPNTPEQEESGQDQRQETKQLLFSASWQRAQSDRTVWQASGYARHGKSFLLPSAFDTPLTAEAERTDNRFGALWSLNHQRNRHSIKIGGEASWLLLDERFRFAVTDEDAAEDADLSDAALEHDLNNPFEFSDRQRPWLLALYAQDAYQPSDRITINFGARLDRSHLLIDAWQFSPRAGFSFRMRNDTTVRASVMRLFQPPQAEYLLLSSSEEARELSPFEDDDEIGGGSSIPPERQTAIDVALSHDLKHGFRIDATGWWRRGTDVDDPNVFFGTTVIFPNSIAEQHARGFDASLTMLPRRGWSGSVGYTYARVEQFGPATGGLFLEEEVAAIQDGTKFTPDHDQRHRLVATAAYSDERQGWRVAGTFRYQTGTPVGIGSTVDEDLMDRPGAETVDFEAGRVRPRAVTDLQAEWAVRRGRRADLWISAWLNNVTNELYAFNFGNPFSGTHFGARRRVGVSVRVAWRRGP